MKATLLIPGIAPVKIGKRLLAQLMKDNSKFNQKIQEKISYSNSIKILDNQ